MGNKKIAQGQGNQGSVTNGGIACCWFALTAGEILLQNLVAGKPLVNDTCNKILADTANRIEKAKNKKQFQPRYYAYDEIPAEFNPLEYITIFIASNRVDQWKNASKRNQTQLEAFAKEKAENNDTFHGTLSRQLERCLNAKDNEKGFRRDLKEERRQFVTLHDIPIAMLFCYNGHWTCAVNLPENDTVYYYDSLTNAITQCDSFDDLVQLINGTPYNEIEVYISTLPFILDSQVENPEDGYTIREVKITPSMGKPENTSSTGFFSTVFKSFTSVSKKDSSNPTTVETNPKKSQNSNHFDADTSKPAITQNKYSPIKNYATIAEKLSETTIKKNKQALLCLEKVRPALGKLTILKNTLQKEFTAVVKDTSTEIATKTALEDMTIIINQLCGDIAGITDFYLTKENFCLNEAKQLSISIIKKINTCLANEKIKQSSTSTNPVIKAIGPTLRGIVSLLLCLSMVPLFSSHVRDHLFSNHKEYTLKRARRVFDNLPQQLILKA